MGRRRVTWLRNGGRLLRSPAGLIVIGYAILMTAWMFATPPFGGFDEPAHYVRAAGIAEGQLLGPRVPLAQDLPYPPGANSVGHSWAQRDTRGVRLSAALTPAHIPCVDGATNSRGTCIVPTWVGDYPPIAYVLPAIATKFAHSATSGDLLGRVGAILLNLALIGLAVALLWDGTASSLLGLLLAVTPSVLFLGSIINPNGTEIAGAIAAIAAVLRVARQRDRAPTWVWVALAVSCAITMLARQLDAFWVAASLLILPALLGLGDTKALIKARPRAVSATFGTICLVFVAYLAWTVVAGTAHPVSFSPFPHSVALGVKTLHQDVKDAVGVFGWGIKVWVPRLPFAAWILALSALLAVAFVSVRNRHRVALFLAILGSVVFATLFYAGVYRRSGFGMDGRYVLALLVLVPLLGGELAASRLSRAGAAFRRSAVGSVAAVVAVGQLTSWWVAAQVNVSQGKAWWKVPDRGSWWLPASHGWHPPGGWIPWMCLALVGSLSVFSLAFSGRAVNAARSSPLADRLWFWRRAALQNESAG